MDEERKYTRLRVQNFGPFREAEIELAPLTIFIGKNALGKSMLLYLIWTLESTLPDLKILFGALKEQLIEVYKQIFEEREEGELLKELVIEGLKILPIAWVEKLKESLHRVFGAKPQELIHQGEENMKILIEGYGGEMEISIRGDEVLARWLKFDDELIRKIFSIEFKEKIFRAKLEEVVEEEYITHPLDLLEVLAGSMVGLMRSLFPYIVVGAGNLLVDGRAGITRTLYTTYPGVGLMIRDILKADFHFIDSLYKLASDYMKGNVDLKAPALKLLLRELNFEPIIEGEFGIPRIYVEALGRRIPLEKSPSGIRETLPIILALLSKEPSPLYIEEPETHLHPGAIMLLPRLMGYSINKLGKAVRMTTHSDTLIVAINNLIALSSNPEGAEELGYSEEELITPEEVRAYLMRKADDYVEVAPLPVEEDGFDESAFEEVSEELFMERSEVMRLLEEKKKSG